jgi:hypothetical protein
MPEKNTLNPKKSFTFLGSGRMALSIFLSMFFIIFLYNYSSHDDILWGWPGVMEDLYKNEN